MSAAVLSTTTKIGTPDAPVQRAPDITADSAFALARSRYADAIGALQSARAALKRAENDVDHSYAGRVAALYATPGANVADEVQAIRDKGSAARAAIPLLKDKEREAQAALEDARAGLRHVIQKQVMQRRADALARFSAAAAALRNAYTEVTAIERFAIGIQALKQGSFDFYADPIKVVAPADAPGARTSIYGADLFITSEPDERAVSESMRNLDADLRALAGEWPFP